MKKKSIIYVVGYTGLRVFRVGILIINILIKALKQIIYTKINKKILNLKEIRKWYKMGMHPPAPPVLKHKIVKAYADKFLINLFVETGTYLGEMVDATRRTFEKIYSIELDDTLYKNAKKKYIKYNHISLIHGDSSKILPIIFSKIKQSCLFWLDAHYSGGITGKGEVETPIREELNCILKNSKFDHVILIDDARLFIGKKDYPTLKELKKLISKKRPNYYFIVKKDIIRIHKKI